MTLGLFLFSILLLLIFFMEYSLKEGLDPGSFCSSYTIEKCIEKKDKCILVEGKCQKIKSQ